MNPGFTFSASVSRFKSIEGYVLKLVAAKDVFSVTLAFTVVLNDKVSPVILVVLASSPGKAGRL